MKEAALYPIKPQLDHSLVIQELLGKDLHEHPIREEIPVCGMAEILLKFLSISEKMESYK